MTFVVDRKLLNSKFEGYKLDLVDQDKIISRFPLDQRVSQATISSRTLLSFQEVQSRISHNHLFVSPSKSCGIYVDEEYRIVQIGIASDTFLPSTKVVYELPRPVISSSFESHPEYPSAAFASEELLFLSDGYGLMYLLRHSLTGPFTLISTYQLKSSPDRPFRIHSVEFVGANISVAILSSRNSDSQITQASTVRVSERKPSPVEFDIFAVKFDLSSPQGSAGSVYEMDVLWSRRGDDVPIYTGYNPSCQTFFLIGGSSYRSLQTPPPPPYDPSPDEIVPIPRPNENLDETDPAKPPPYSWVQTSDSVTVAFPLPSSTPKSHIHVQLNAEGLTLDVEEESSSVIPLPKYTSKTFWDRISPSSSYWTWDREAEHSFGCLTLHLDKQREGTKWMHVFAAAGTKPTSESSSEDVEVPETLDPSEIWHIREALEKYTAALTTGEDASGLGLGRGVPSFAEGEIDEDVDFSVGRVARISWVSPDGSSPSWFKPGREQPFQLLSLPFPGISFPSLSLIMKEGVDGVVFTLGSEKAVPKWAHTKTFCALSFVLASKQDVRFTFHTDDLVLAFENGLRDRGGNVYVYRGTNEIWGKQAILKLGDGAAGSLLGIGMLEVQGQLVVVALAEKELITLKIW